MNEENEMSMVFKFGIGGYILFFLVKLIELPDHIEKFTVKIGYIIPTWYRLYWYIQFLLAKGSLISLRNHN